MYVNSREYIARSSDLVACDVLEKGCPKLYKESCFEPLLMVFGTLFFSAYTGVFYFEVLPVPWILTLILGVASVVVAVFCGLTVLEWLRPRKRWQRRKFRYLVREGRINELPEEITSVYLDCLKAKNLDRREFQLENWTYHHLQPLFTYVDELRNHDPETSLSSKSRLAIEALFRQRMEEIIQDMQKRRRLEELVKTAHNDLHNLELANRLKLERSMLVAR